MDLQWAITRMIAAGVIIQTHGDRLFVQSRAPLTERQRLFIRAHKADLLRFVSGSSSAIPVVSNEDRLAIQEAFEERAAILEYEAGMTRVEAEREAARLYPDPEPMAPRGDLLRRLETQ